MCLVGELKDMFREEIDVSQPCLAYVLGPDGYGVEQKVVEDILKNDDNACDVTGTDWRIDD